MTTRTEHIAVPDGEFDAHVALPASGSGPGLVVLQEIFGVNVYIRDACRRLTELGYVTLAPELYWRSNPGLVMDEHSEEQIARGLEAVQKLDFPAAAGDSIAALEHLRGLPEVDGARAGVLGFCLGGSLAYMIAAYDGPDVAVGYYGSGIHDALGLAGQIGCPTLLHFGGADPFIPREHVDAVAAMAADHGTIECHVHEGAGHAFDNGFSALFHNPAAAATAWEQSRAFLELHLPVT